MASIRRHLQSFLDALGGGARQREPRTRTVDIVDRTRRLMRDRKVGDMPGVATRAIRAREVLAGSPSGHRYPTLACPTGHARVKVRIPFDAQRRILKGSGRSSAGCAHGGLRRQQSVAQGKGEAAGELHELSTRSVH
jgi:hypothetical protein